MTNTTFSTETASGSAGPTPLPALDDDFVVWVDWLRATYELQHWPDCWRSHPGLILEAAALRMWNLAAVAAGSQPAEWFAWHEGMWKFSERVTERGRRCVGGCVGG